MLKLGLQKKTEAEKLIKPGIITDNLFLRHSYNDGKYQTVGEGCVTLDGSSDFMYWSDITDFDGEDALTFAMWIKLADANIQPLITKGVYNTSGDAFVWQYDPGTSSGQMQFSIGNSVTGTLNSCNLTTDGSKWHHVAVTYDNARDEIYFFLDGVRTAATTSGSFVSIPNVSEVMGLGINSDASQMFCGSMCQVNIWKGTPVITESQMQKIMWKSYDQFTTGDKARLWGNFPMHEWVDYGTDYVDNVHNSVDSHTSTDNINQASIVRKNLLNSSGVRVDRKFADHAPPVPRAFDLSGNNNHGKLYSGRAIGVGNLGININTGYNLKTAGFKNSFTIACWFKMDTFPGVEQAVFSLTEDVNNRFHLSVKSDGKIYLYDNIGGTNEYRYGVYIDTKTWYRIVVVLDNLQPVLYMNGKALRVTGNTWAELPVSDGVDSYESQLYIAYTGMGGPGSLTLVDAFLSDFQVWNLPWDAKDVIYDYNNPEKMVSDRNISSLKITNSPSSNLKLWYPMNGGHVPGSKLFDATPKHLHSGSYDGTVTYVAATTELLSANNQSFESSDVSTDSTVEGGWIQNTTWGGGPSTVHAATLSRSTAVADDGSYSLKVSRVNNDGTAIFFGAALRVETTPGCEYVWIVKQRNVSTSNPCLASSPRVVSNIDGTPSYNIAQPSFFGGSGQDQWNTFTVYFTATTSTTWLAVTALDVDAAPAEFYVDSMSLKQVGTGFRWGNADQQPVIPQTLLQSYNELYFPLVGKNKVSLGDHDDFSFGDGSDDVDMTISAWVYINGTGQYLTILEKPNEYHFGIENNKLVFVTYDSNASHQKRMIMNVSLAGDKWYHVAVGYDESQTNLNNRIDFYVDGVEIADSAKSSGTTGTYVAMHNTSNVATIHGIIATGWSVSPGIGTDHNEANTYTQSIVGELAVYKGIDVTSIGSPSLGLGIAILYNNGFPISPVGIFTANGFHFSYDLYLKGYWRNSGAGTWEDLSGNNHHATLADSATGGDNISRGIKLIPTISGKKDVNGFDLNSQRTTNAANFTGGASYGYIEIPETTYDVDGSPTTFSFWIKLYSNKMADDLRSGDTAIFGAENNGYKSIYLNSALTRLTIEGDTDGNLAYRDFSALSYNTWYNFAIVCEGGNVTMYKDGVTLGTMDDGTIGVNMTIKYIGKQESTREMHGQLDDILIYNSALSASDVKRNYDAQITHHK